MKKKNLIILLLLINNISTAMGLEIVNDADVVVCQDQAENYGNGKGDDFIAPKCLDGFKKLSTKKAISVANSLKMNFYGHKNMIIVEKYKGKKISTETIAGNSTELKSIQAVVTDEKNQEIVILEESGDILFFTTKLTGNIAPARIIKHKDLLGATEIAIDIMNNQVIINNKKSNKILFFKRLANSNAPLGKQQLEILKVINTSSTDFNELKLNIEKNEIEGIDLNLNQKTTFPIK